MRAVLEAVWISLLALAVREVRCAWQLAKVSEVSREQYPSWAAAVEARRALVLLRSRVVHKRTLRAMHPRVL